MPELSFPVILFIVVIVILFIAICVLIFDPPIIPGSKHIKNEEQKDYRPFSSKRFDDGTIEWLMDKVGKLRKDSGSTYNKQCDIIDKVNELQKELKRVDAELIKKKELLAELIDYTYGDQDARINKRRR